MTFSSLSFANRRVYTDSEQVMFSTILPRTGGPCDDHHTSKTKKKEHIFSIILLIFSKMNQH